MVDGRMPIACISSRRILHMVCNPPPEISLQMTKKPTSSYMSAKTVNRSICPDLLARFCCLHGPCKNITRHEVDKIRLRLFNEAETLINHTVKTYNELSDILLIAPVISDADFWTNDEAIVGESIQLDLKDRAVSDTVFGVNVSINGKGERWQNIFLDVDSAQLYLLTPLTTKPKKKQPNLNQVGRYLSSSGSEMSIIVESPMHTNGNGEAKVDEKPLAHNTGRNHTFTNNGGRILRVFDLLDFSRHVDLINLHLVSLYFDDAVRTSFMFRFQSFPSAAADFWSLSQMSPSE